MAVIDGIKRFQPYLRAKKFVIHTDHNALKWLMSIQDPSNRIARWTLLIQQFDFDIVHRPGTTNGNADALSRRLYGTCSLNALEHVGVKTKEIYDFQRRDSDLADIIDYLENDQLPHDSVRAKRVLLSLTCDHTLPPLYLDAVKEGMIHLLVGSYVKKPDSGVFSDWSRNNAYETLRSYWLTYFNLISGQKVETEARF